MIVTEEMDMDKFEPWSGAVSTYDRLLELDCLGRFQEFIEEMYPEGCSSTQINDILWFEEDEFFAEICGVSIAKWNGEEEEEEEEEEETENE
jgi:hypothetical protein